MAIDFQTLAVAKKFTEESLLGGGAIAGKNVTISSIIPFDGGNEITFSFVLDDGTPKTEKVKVMNGKDGISIPSGGITGQMLIKKSNNDYDYEWTDVPTDDGNKKYTMIQGIL